jgi:histidyl-tRNA synthetase
MRSPRSSLLPRQGRPRDHAAPGGDAVARPHGTARQRDFKKPIKWFQIGPCFRYEEPQEGRGREFIQFNADILGDSGPATAAELISLAIDTCASLA